MVKQKFLLHTCCAPCSAYIIQLLRECYDVAGYFYNPNIHPEEEYQKRLAEEKKYFDKIGVKLIVGSYDKKKWFELIKGHENDPEKGERCWICYRMRLEQAGRFAKDNGYDVFTTTLSLSPHKDFAKIKQIGREIGSQYGIKFLEQDLKKQDGFKKSLEISKHEHFYRQNYCGCIYSQKRYVALNNS